jgi:hypothetical protein
MKWPYAIFFGLVLSVGSVAKTPAPAKSSRKPATSQDLSLASESSDEEQLLKQFPALKKDCEDMDILPLALHGQSAEPFELVVSCTTKCTQDGCPYSVFVKTEKGFRRIAEFFGTYEVLQSKTNGYQDIKVKSSTLKYNGTQYH